MNSKLLIDSVIRQTTVLIAELATTAGLRAPLAHVANQVFLDLSSELESQGLGRKVIADMFGLHLRSYQLKVQRLSESLTDRDQSLWQAVFDFVRGQKVVSRGKILTRFCDDDEAQIGGILHDLVETGLVFKTGRGHKSTYRAATDEELNAIFAQDEAETATWLVWMSIHHHGPVTMEAIARTLQADEEIVEQALFGLLDDGRIVEEEIGEELVYRSDVCVIPMDDPNGWEAAVFDHFNAVVSTVCTKLRQRELRSLPSDAIGGSTYSFDLWDEHPHEEEVMGLLKRFREELSELRQTVTDYNDDHGRPADATRNVTFYLGQTIRDPHELEEEEEEASDNGTSAAGGSDE